MVEKEGKCFLELAEDKAFFRQPLTDLPGFILCIYSQCGPSRSLPLFLKINLF